MQNDKLIGFLWHNSDHLKETDGEILALVQQKVGSEIPKEAQDWVVAAYMTAKRWPLS